MVTVLDERLLTVEEAAAHLQVSIETVRRWLRSGALRGIRIGGSRAGYRIPVGDLARFVAARATRPAA